MSEWRTAVNGESVQTLTDEIQQVTNHYMFMPLRSYQYYRHTYIMMCHLLNLISECLSHDFNMDISVLVPVPVVGTSGIVFYISFPYNYIQIIHFKKEFIITNGYFDDSRIRIPLACAYTFQLLSIPCSYIRFMFEKNCCILSLNY
jgi:hypothetical protein